MERDWARIHPNAKISSGVEIGPFTHIHGDVVIGEGTKIHSNVVIMDGARIGKNCEIFPGAVISAIPQDLKFSGEKTTVEIGDNTTIREFVTLNRGTVDQYKTTIGHNCLLMAYVHIGHDCTVGNHVIMANNASLSGHVVVEDYAILEGMVGVQQFIRIGSHSFIAGGTLVRKNVPPYTKAAREPISYIGINSVGLRRRGFDERTISEIESAYRQIYVLNKTVGAGVKSIEESMADTPVKWEIINFIKASTKGIMKGPVND